MLQRHLGNIVLVVGGDLGWGGAIIPNISEKCKCINNYFDF